MKLVFVFLGLLIFSTSCCRCINKKWVTVGEELVKVKEKSAEIVSKDVFMENFIVNKDYARFRLIEKLRLKKNVIKVFDVKKEFRELYMCLNPDAGVLGVYLFLFPIGIIRTIVFPIQPVSEEQKDLIYKLKEGEVTRQGPFNDEVYRIKVVKRAKSKEHVKDSFFTTKTKPLANALVLIYSISENNQPVKIYSDKQGNVKVKLDRLSLPELTAFSFEKLKQKLLDYLKKYVKRKEVFDFYEENFKSIVASVPLVLIIKVAYSAKFTKKAPALKIDKSSIESLAYKFITSSLARKLSLKFSSNATLRILYPSIFGKYFSDALLDKVNNLFKYCTRLKDAPLVKKEMPFKAGSVIILREAEHLFEIKTDWCILRISLIPDKKKLELKDFILIEQNDELLSKTVPSLRKKIINYIAEFVDKKISSELNKAILLGAHFKEFTADFSSFGKIRIVKHFITKKEVRKRLEKILSDMVQEVTIKLQDENGNPLTDAVFNATFFPPFKVSKTLNLPEFLKGKRRFYITDKLRLPILKGTKIVYQVFHPMATFSGEVVVDKQEIIIKKTK